MGQHQMEENAKAATLVRGALTIAWRTGLGMCMYIRTLTRS
jgi:hypothetical protein